MYVFNKIIVEPQLPKSINRLDEIANNLWWSWNSEYLKLLKQMDKDLWERVEKNPIKFLTRISQERLEKAANDSSFVKEYEKILKNYDDYITSKDTWFNKNYPENKKDLIAYFSAEYGLDETIPIYSGGLGILSGDHLKSASDLGVPLIGIGLLYKNGYFNQKIESYGIQKSEYTKIDLEELPIHPVKNDKNEDFIINVKFLNRTIYLKVWKINVGRIALYLLDSDIEENIPEDREITLKLYGGDQDMRIRQEIVLGMGGVKFLKEYGLTPTLYHMNEGHSAFLTLELIKDTIREKQVSFDIARDIVTSKTVFTTHTPVPAGNDIFPLELMDKYFNKYWERLSIDREEFLKMGMKPCTVLEPGFNMGILALKIAGKKNGVSKLHGEVSRELFGDVWPNIAANESPITHVTNGIHTCSWVPQDLKELFNKYLTTAGTPYWQDKIYLDETWKRVKNIPDEELWKVHQKRKGKLIEFVKENTTNRLRRAGVSYEEIREIVNSLNTGDLIIGFARRFATYKRATLIFNDLERITEILNDSNHPVKLIFAGKAHPADKEGQDLIKYIHEISMKPQFRGKVFLLENYNIAMSRYLISGVDVWLNNPRRPMEASGTSGQKASVNGVINFSVLDGWWEEGYDQTNGWTIGTDAKYLSYSEQDLADSQSIYKTLENKIIPTFFARNSENEPSKQWMEIMKQSIITTGGKYSTARMLVDYTKDIYIPLINLYNNYFSDLEKAGSFTSWKKNVKNNWDNILIEQTENPENIKIEAGQQIEVGCKVTLPNLEQTDIIAEVYCGKISDDGRVEEVKIIPMKLVGTEKEYKRYEYKAKVTLTSGGNYGYTFRVMPTHEMLLDNKNLDLVKWITK